MLLWPPSYESKWQTGYKTQCAGVVVVITLGTQLPASTIRLTHNTLSVTAKASRWPCVTSRAPPLSLQCWLTAVCWCGITSAHLPLFFFLLNSSRQVRERTRNLVNKDIFYFMSTVFWFYHRTVSRPNYRILSLYWVFVTKIKTNLWRSYVALTRGAGQSQNLPYLNLNLTTATITMITVYFSKEIEEEYWCNYISENLVTFVDRTSNKCKPLRKKLINSVA